MMNLPDLPNLPDPEVLGQYAKAISALLDLVKKFRDALPRRQEGGKRDLEKELDALEANLLQVVGELMKFLESHEKVSRAFLEAGPKIVDSLIQLINQFGVVNRLTAKLADLVPDHERRLTALEQQSEVRRKPVPPRRSLVVDGCPLTPRRA